MTTTGTTPPSLTARMNAAVATEDPLIGAVPEPDAESDGAVVLPAASGRALGVAQVRNTPLDSPLALWQASTHEFLQLRVAADATTADIGEVLDAWLARPDAQIAEADGDHARSVRLPITVRQAVLPLIERGFAPNTSTLARPTRPADAAPTPREPVAIRQSEPADRDRMRRLMRELISTEEPFGAVRARAPELSDTYADEALSYEPG